MKTKTRSILYWVTISLLCLWLIADGLAGVFHVAAGADSLTQLGYPLYVLTITGVAKIIGAIAIFQNKYRTIKEWAFAGYAIDCIGAAASWFFIQGSPINIVMPLVFLAFMFVPYTLWKKRLSANPA
ncbi:MAG: DoxX family protein [Parcubacteria group bacterium]|nr:DoxX family protein [Parcubacteria group bacterium]